MDENRGMTWVNNNRMRLQIWIRSCFMSGFDRMVSRVVMLPVLLIILGEGGAFGGLVG